MIKLEVLDKNPLSLVPLLAKKLGYFDNEVLEVEIGYVPSFPAFDMTKVTANVGDTTRIFERIKSGEDLIITSDLTRTMKLILCDDYLKKNKLKILASETQSLGIYTEQFFKEKGLEFEYVIETNMQKRIALIKSGQVDGACMIDPFLIEFIGNGYFIAYEGKSDEHNYTCWAFHRRYHEQNPGNVIKFHKSMNKAIVTWNQYSKEEKLKIAKEMLVVPEHLNDYYQTLEFIEDKAYKQIDLEKCYEWKCQKTPDVKGLNLTEMILKW